MIHSKRSEHGVRRMRFWYFLVIALMPGLISPSGTLLLGQQPQETPSATTPPPISTTPHVEAITSMRSQKVESPAAVPPHKQNYEFKVTSGDWVDTGVHLAAGEIASFTVSGDLTLADGRKSTADGLDRGWKDLIRQFPLNSAKVGALVGRVSDIGASVPFSIGAAGQVTMPTTGKLFLRANLSSDLTATGEYKVNVKFTEPQKFKTNVLAAPASSPISTLITPANFDTIPRRVTDTASGNGNPGDMVNFALVGTEQEVKDAFKAAGWVAVDKSVQDAILSGLMATLNREAYTAMPMSTLYLFDRPQDMSYARADPLLVAAERHHLRVWKSDQMIDGRPLWVGSATHDIGFEKDQRTGGVTHKIDPEIDKERDYILQSFDAAGVYSSAAYVMPSNPMQEARTATGGSFHSDGRIVVMALK
ncbi:MAG: LssY C-terminal domain-containing protein [Edaphobacter sp.]|uniref:LssY C-terminal domain-containing protein n=1 Tax=Edaphobacter sp. TaxID=1934404 RepID=UPI002399E85E|nr:LssY C-terminal domain-containing protein [Edaphobacter sp.]MDE1175962.1 LssY C-terminal domain-containing protein [Edaphobacter sp.]